MSRVLVAILALAVLSGCVPQAETDLRPFVSAVGGYVAVQEVTPPDDIKPGKCRECRGTGKLGDGTVAVDCPVCGGDGVIGEDEVPVTHPVTVKLSSLPESKPAPPTKRVECVNGKCQTVISR